jgi:hypothetical protein
MRETIVAAIIFKQFFRWAGQQIGITVCSDFLKDAHEVHKNTFEHPKTTGRIRK